MFCSKKRNNADGLARMDLHCNYLRILRPRKARAKFIVAVVNGERCSLTTGFAICHSRNRKIKIACHCCQKAHFSTGSASWMSTVECPSGTDGPDPAGRNFSPLVSTHTLNATGKKTNSEQPCADLDQGLDIQVYFHLKGILIQLMPWR